MDEHNEPIETVILMKNGSEMVFRRSDIAEVWKGMMHPDEVIPLGPAPPETVSGTPDAQ